MCGKWESFPREFAKCRRCRKAKYCGKECQSRAWSEGHRFWCSAREGEDNLDGPTTTATTTASSHTGHSRHTHQQIVGLGDGAGEDVEQQQQQQQQHNPANANNNTRNGQLNVALAARLQRREERERARQQMAAAAAAAMASIPPARLANAIRQRTQAANAAAAVNTSANANGGAGTSAASHVEEGHVGEAADRERRRGEHHLHARTVMRGRMLRTAMNEGDGERSRGSAGSANGESSSGGGGERRKGRGTRTGSFYDGGGGNIEWRARSVYDGRNAHAAAGDDGADVRTEDGRHCELDDGWNRRACAGD